MHCSSLHTLLHILLLSNSYQTDTSSLLTAATDARRMTEEYTKGVVVDDSMQRAPVEASVDEIRRMLLIIKNEILPKTTTGVTNGNKVFGAAILNDKLETVLADSNEETTCPLFHAEVKAIYEWSKIVPATQRGPAAQSSIFLATHEPCCMCISSIVWSGFNKCFYFFPYHITSAQGIPHDINTMHELWGVNSYRKRNKYISTECLMDLISNLDDSIPDKKELLVLQQELLDTYDRLSNKYHSEKESNTNNTLVLG